MGVSLAQGLLDHLSDAIQKLVGNGYIYCVTRLPPVSSCSKDNNEFAKFAKLAQNGLDWVTISQLTAICGA